MMHRRGAGTGCEIPGAGGRCSRFRADIKSAPTVWTEVHAVGGVPGPGGWRADVGIGPYEAEPSNSGGNRNLVPGGHKARPYGKTGGGSVGADFISAHTHRRRVGCTHPVGADAHIGPLGIDNKSTIAGRTRCGARLAMVRYTQGRRLMHPPHNGIAPICGWRRLRWPASRRSGRRRRRGWWGCRRRPRTRGRAPGGRRGRGR